MQVVEEIKKEGKIIEISVDENAENPREWCDHLGKMVCFHKRYDLGDKTDLKSNMFGSWDELEGYLIKEKHAEVIYPLFLYDHSGITIKIGNFNGLLPQGHAHFDSGQVGFIYATKEDIKKETDLGMKKENVAEILKAEVEEYDAYLRGDVYMYTIYAIGTCDMGQEHKTVIDSCGGFYSVKDALECAEENFK